MESSGVGDKAEGRGLRVSGAGEGGGAELQQHLQIGRFLIKNEQTKKT